MKPSKNQETTPSENQDGARKQRARLLGERQKIVERLKALQEQELASYIRAPYLELSNAIALR